MLNLRKKQKQHQQRNTLPLYVKQTVCNMSSYVLSNEEQLALSFGLDQYVTVACICQTVLLVLFLIFKTTLAIWQITS